jgi:hypothetical protein
MALTTLSQVIDWAHPRVSSTLCSEPPRRTTRPTGAGGLQGEQIDQSDHAPQAALDEFRDRFRDPAAAPACSRRSIAAFQSGFYKELARLVKAGSSATSCHQHRLAFQQALSLSGWCAISFRSHPVGHKDFAKR